MQKIPYIQPGDLIKIIAPAKAIEAEHVLNAKAFLELKGYKVEIGKHCLGSHFYFSGTDQERMSDFQEAIDNPAIKAIICARGGYGSVRIVDRIQWASQLRNPKWIVGFSDITVFHLLMNQFELPSIHATMPLNFQQNSNEALQTLMDSLEGKAYEITISSNKHNKNGQAIGEVIGGNLSIVYSLLGTDIKVDFKNKILFIEEVGEQIYAVDRMLYSLKKAGVLDAISGLIIGGMTDIKDSTANSTGLTIEQIVLQHFVYRNIPICFDFPAGHIDDNRAIIFGQNVHLNVSDSKTTLKFNI